MPKILLTVAQAADLFRRLEAVEANLRRLYHTVSMQDVEAALMHLRRGMEQTFPAAARGQRW